MDKLARIKRISEMEDRFDKVTSILGELDKVLREYEDVKDDLDSLKDYMGSGKWQEDYEADEAGKVPADLKRGVLSEDGLYNLLHDADVILGRAQEVFN